MASVLMVDDEIIGIQAIYQGVNWEKCGVSEVFLCDSAREAQKILEREDIALVISDIEMPEMDGLELAEWIRKYDADLMIILLTGYAEFEYAKKAVTLSVEEYVLKPVIYSELELKIQELLKKKSHIDKRKKVSKAYTQNKGAFISDFIYQLILKKEILSEDKLIDLMEKCCVELELERDYVLMLFAFPQIREEERIGVFLECVQKQLQEIVAVSTLVNVTLERKLFLLQRANYGVGIIEQLREIALQNIDNCSEDVCCYMSDFVKLTQVQENLKKIRSRAEKNVIYNKVFLVGNRGFVQGKESIEIDYGIWEALLQDGKFDELMQKIEFVTHKLVLYEYMDDEQLRKLYNQFMQILYSYIGRSAVDFRTVMRQEELSGLQKHATDSVKGFLLFIKKVIQSLEDFIEKSSRQNQLIEEAKSYIERHLSEKITREEIAAHVSLNASYLSRVFHREIGMSISDYITSEKMRLAKNFLLQSNYSISRITELVGYDAPAYFIKVFKKEVGMTPKEFRKREKI